jgi:hypothetical protein
MAVYAVGYLPRAMRYEICASERRNTSSGSVDESGTREVRRDSQASQSVLFALVSGYRRC